MHLKIAISKNSTSKLLPQKNAFQKCYQSSIVIVGIRKLSYFHRIFKKSNTNSPFKQTEHFFITLLECCNHYGKILVLKLLKN